MGTSIPLPQEVITFAVKKSSLGHVLVASTSSGVCCIMLDDSPDALRAELESRFPRAALREGGADYQKTVQQVQALVQKPSQKSRLPLDIRGTHFQKLVWKALQSVPAGTTATYADIARAIRRPRAVRAVAQACGANHIALAIPCHRIIRSDGSLSGYRWGIGRKKAILEREAGIMG